MGVGFGRREGSRVVRRLPRVSVHSKVPERVG